MFCQNIANWEAQAWALSNSSTAVIQQSLVAAQLEQAFECVWSGSDTSQARRH